MTGPTKPPVLSARPPKAPQPGADVGGEIKTTDLADRLRQAQARGFLDTGDGSDAVSAGPSLHIGKVPKGPGSRGRKGDPKNADRTQLIVRLPPDLHEQLKFVARHSPHHTVQGLIEHLVLQGLPAEYELAKQYADRRK